MQKECVRIDTRNRKECQSIARKNVRQNVRKRVNKYIYIYIVLYIYIYINACAVCLNIHKYTNFQMVCQKLCGTSVSKWGSLEVK